MASKSKCPVCGSELTEDAVSCPTCGTAFSEDEEHTCPLCEGVVSEDDEKCPSCGAEFDSTDWEGPTKPRPDAEAAAEEGEMSEEVPPEEPAVAGAEDVEEEEPEIEAGPEEIVREEEIHEEPGDEPSEDAPEPTRADAGTEDEPSEPIQAEPEGDISEEEPEPEDEPDDEGPEDEPDDEGPEEDDDSDEDDDEPISFETDLEAPRDAPVQEDEPPVDEPSDVDEPEPARAEEEPPETEDEAAPADEETEEPPPVSGVDDEEPPAVEDADDDEPPPVAEIDDDLDEPPPVADVDDAPPDDLPPMDDEAILEEESKKDGLVDQELEDLVKLNGIGPLKAKILFDAGYTDLRKLKAATVVELMKVRGIGRKSAGEIKATLREIDLADIKQQELKIEQVETEYQCPLCGTVVSAFESSCYECGTVFDTDREEEDEEDADRLALSYYDSKLLRTPDNPDLWYARGSTLVKMENYDMALKSFDRALEVDPGFQTAWISKAEVYNKLGDPIKAAECYGQVISKVGTARAGERDVEGGLEVPDMQVTAEDVKDFEAELAIEEPPAEPEEPKPSDEEMDKELGLDDEDDQKAGEPPAEEPEAAEAAGPEPAEVPAEVEAAAEPAAEAEPAEAVEEAAPAAEEEIAEEPPAGEDELKPEDIRTTVVEEPPDMRVKMDFTKLPMDEQLKGMSEKELKKLLSKQAAHVKPLLLLSKEADVDVGPAKRLIAKGVAESKGGDMIEAVKYMGQGLEIIESRFKVKLSEDLNVLADLVRELKVSGMDVSKAVDMMSSAKDLVDGRDFKEAVEQLNELLELLERVRS